jgi:putative PIN family toxin of toxin-antitoxin system
MSRRVVVDTNVVLDLWHFDDIGARALRAMLDTGALRVVTSDAVDAELADVLSRARFCASRDAVLARWRAVAETVPVAGAAPWACRDPGDQKLLDLAVCAQAAGLITKDKALLSLARRAAAAGLLIATPDRFVEFAAAAEPVSAA